MAGSFMVHAGGEVVDRVAVQRVAMPEATESYCPVAHDRVVELVQGAMAEMGLAIAGEQYALAKEGDRFFGLFDIKGDKPDYNLVLGMRNSHDKSFPAALSLGSRVFVCDNLAFSGEIQIARRHTRFIERDLPRLVMQATAALIESRGAADKRIEAYKGAELSDTDAHDLIVRAARNAVIPGGDILNIVTEWHKPTHEDFAPRNAWSLFNAFTEVGKKWGAQLPARTNRLHGLFDSACGVVGALESLKGAAGVDSEIVVNN